MKELLNLAQRYSGHSNDPRKRVGCVIVVDDDPYVFGYNHFPKGIKEDWRINNKEMKNNMIIHAEQDAINKGDSVKLKGATLYVWPIPPCNRCAASIIDVGIVKVVTLRPPDHTSWRSKLHMGVSMLDEAGVKFIQL